jgi:hypothetical protein
MGIARGEGRGVTAEGLKLNNRIGRGLESRGAEAEVDHSTAEDLMEDLADDWAAKHQRAIANLFILIRGLSLMLFVKSCSQRCRLFSRL